MRRLVAITQRYWVMEVQKKGPHNTMRALKSFTPSFCNSLTSEGLMRIGSGFFNQVAAIKPPANIPKTKKRFHASFFQLYLKNGMLEGKHAAQICRSEEETPNDLFPAMSNAGTTRPIRGPAIHHGHGLLIHSIKFILKKFGE